MLSHLQREKLIANWGQKAESLECKAEVKIHDPLTGWKCYIFALNPDTDEILCIIKASKYFAAVVTDWNLGELALTYNAYGEAPQVDEEYRPRYVQEILKKLRGE
jgi:hypothetical protein